MVPGPAPSHYAMWSDRWREERTNSIIRSVNRGQGKEWTMRRQEARRSGDVRSVRRKEERSKPSILTYNCNLLVSVNKRQH